MPPENGITDLQKLLFLRKELNKLGVIIKENNNGFPGEISIDNLDEIQIFLRSEFKPLLANLKELQAIFAVLSKRKITFPKNLEFKIDKAGELKALLEQLLSTLSSKEFSPTINVEPSVIPRIEIPEIKLPNINVPTPQVNIEPIDFSRIIKALNPLKLLSNKATKPITVRLSDGLKFIKALQDVVEKQEKTLTAFATSVGMTEDEFKNKFEKLTQATKAVGFKVTVDAAGTPKVLGVADCYKVQLSGDPDAGEILVVGGSNAVRATTGNKNGIVIIPGNPPVTIDIDNLSKLWVDAESNGGILCGVYYQR